MMLFKIILPAILIVLLHGSVIEALSLFSVYPKLENSLSYYEFGAFPTPLQSCQNLAAALGCKKIYCKRDDLTVAPGNFGGNKIRKLQFLLAEAHKRGAKNILTYGCIGSNHAAATAWWSKKLGFECTCVLRPQKINEIVHRNLLIHAALGTHLEFATKTEEVSAATTKWHDKVKQETSTELYVIPTGGSCALGCIGYVNAAFELYEQIQSKSIEIPEIIVLPAGSCGTGAGLAVGLRLLQFPGKLILIAVERGGGVEKMKERLTSLAQKTNELLHEHDETIPLLDWNIYEWHLFDDYVGDGYAHATDQGDAAKQLFKLSENIILDDVYSAKAAAGMIGYLHQHPEIEMVIFFNTFCSDPFKNFLKDHEFYELPEQFHQFFNSEN